MSAKVWIAMAAAAALAAGGYAAWTHFGRDCCRVTATSAGEPKAAGAVPAPAAAALIAAQGYCPVMSDTKLGQMGDPFKVVVKSKDGKEEPVFACCKGCQRKALADPDKTLAKVAELKAAAAKK